MNVACMQIETDFADDWLVGKETETWFSFVIQRIYVIAERFMCTKNSNGWWSSRLCCCWIECSFICFLYMFYVNRDILLWYCINFLPQNGTVIKTTYFNIQNVMAGAAHTPSRILKWNWKYICAYTLTTSNLWSLINYESLKWTKYHRTKS